MHEAPSPKDNPYMARLMGARQRSNQLQTMRDRIAPGPEQPDTLGALLTGLAKIYGGGASLALTGQANPLDAVADLVGGTRAAKDAAVKGQGDPLDVGMSMIPMRGSMRMPTSSLDRYKQYDVPRYGPAKPLEDSLAKGWKPDDPLVLKVTDKGHAWVSDGNHRLAISKRQGAADVPVRIERVPDRPEGAAGARLTPGDAALLGIKPSKTAAKGGHGADVRAELLAKRKAKGPRKPGGGRQPKAQPVQPPVEPEQDLMALLAASLPAKAAVPAAIPQTAARGGLKSLLFKLGRNR